MQMSLTQPRGVSLGSKMTSTGQGEEAAAAATPKMCERNCGTLSSDFSLNTRLSTGAANRRALPASIWAILTAPHSAERQEQPFLYPALDCHSGPGRLPFSQASLPPGDTSSPPFAGWGLGSAGKYLFSQEDAGDNCVGVSASSCLGMVCRKAGCPRADPAVISQWEEVKRFLSVLGLASSSC